MSEESLMPERDGIWAKHDGLTPALAAEMLAFAGKMEMERDAAIKARNHNRVCIERLTVERDNALSDFRQADTDSIRALHERNEARIQRDKAEEELASERAIADQLAAIVQQSRDGHGGMLTDPECFCEDCEHLRVLDAALDRWKEARKPIDKTRDLERCLTIARDALTMIIDTSPSLEHAERMADKALKLTAPKP